MSRWIKRGGWLSNYLLGGSDAERTQFLLQVGDIVLQVDKSLSNAKLEFIGGFSSSELGDLVRSHCQSRMQGKERK